MLQSTRKKEKNGEALPELKFQDEKTRTEALKKNSRPQKRNKSNYRVFR